MMNFYVRFEILILFVVMFVWSTTSKEVPGEAMEFVMSIEEPTYEVLILIIIIYNDHLRKLSEF